MVIIYLAKTECIIVYKADHYFIPLHLDVSVQNLSFILWYYTRLGRIPSLGPEMWNYCLSFH